MTLARRPNGQPASADLTSSQRPATVTVMNLISAKQAARLVHVSRETITYWVRTGRLKKHPYPLSEKSKQIYKRDIGVRYFLLSEAEVLAAADGRTVDKSAA